MIHPYPRFRHACRCLLFGTFAVRVFLLSLVLGSFSAPSRTFAAETATGTITGRVSNAATGTYLESALVAIEGTSLQTATARGGEFSLTVPAGTHTVVVNYTGLDPARETVQV